MNSEHLEEWLERRLPRIYGLDLDPKGIRVRYVLNWGGFVNYSFSVDDGSRRYHLKITNDLDSIARLRGWHKIHNLLEERYRAPKTIDWIDFSEIGFAGLLMQSVDGRTATFCTSPALIEQLIGLIDRLHNDEDIRSHLNASGSQKTYLDHFVETYVDRFTADLEAIAGGEVPFISSTLFQWMRHETNRLRETANSVRAFHNPAVEAVHGDLNEGNVLVTPDDWFVVDWDDLALGDPAIDFAVLLWPMIYQGRKWREFSSPDRNSGFAERIEVCLRAQLLDEVIDPLADYVEACAVPAKQAEVQLVKRERHEEALARYRMLWCP